jgi:hypothetical protein
MMIFLSLELTYVLFSQNLARKSEVKVDKIGEYILFRDLEHCRFGSAPGISSHQFHQFPESVLVPSDSALTQFRNFGNRFDPELVGVSGIELNSGIERNSWGSVRIHRDGIPEIGWNWFRRRN